jgi:hypothetical protein
MNRTRYLTDAVGITLHDTIEEGDDLLTALNALCGPFDVLEDPYPDWHPAPYSFQGMLRPFLYPEITGQSYRSLAQYPELAEAFDLE